MPFTLWKSCGLAMIPATGVLAFLLLAIEEIGVQIEEPFSILPLGKLSHCACSHSAWAPSMLVMCIVSVGTAALASTAQCVGDVKL
jgi:hypothetical protein